MTTREVGRTARDDESWTRRNENEKQTNGPADYKLGRRKRERKQQKQKKNKNKEKQRKIKQRRKGKEKKEQVAAQEMFERKNAK